MPLVRLSEHERAGDVALADAGAAEQEHVVGAVDEVPAGELARLDEHGARHPPVIEGVEGLRRRQARGAAQPVDAALATRARFELEDLAEHDQPVAAVGVEEAPGHLLGGAVQLELGEQRGDAVADLGRVGGHVAPPPMTIK